MLFHRQSSVAARITIIYLLSAIIALSAFLFLPAGHRSCAASVTFSNPQPDAPVYPFVAGYPPHYWAYGLVAAAVAEIINAFDYPVAAMINARHPGPSRSQNNNGNDGGTVHTPEDTAPPAITGAESENEATGVPTDQAIIITFSENVQAGSAYDDIILQDAAGNAIPLDKSINGQIMVLTPVNGIYRGAPINGVITITFDMDLCEAENLAVQLLKGGSADGTIYGRAIGCQLTVPYSSLKYSTVYTVRIPAGSVASKDYATGNEEICWSFATLPAPCVSP